MERVDGKVRKVLSAINLKENTLMIKSMAMEFSYGQVEMNIKMMSEMGMVR